MPTKPPASALTYVTAAFGESLHHKRLESLAAVTGGALKSARLGIAAIGRALAVVNELDPKHAIKQVDRTLSNDALDPWKLRGGLGAVRRRPADRGHGRARLDRFRRR